jgi:hypothetical protein
MNERRLFCPVTFDVSCAGSGMKENTKRHHENFSRHGDLTPGFCACLLEDPAVTV